MSPSERKLVSSVLVLWLLAMGGLFYAMDRDAHERCTVSHTLSAEMCAVFVP